jgi:hypothetical protein
LPPAESSTARNASPLQPGAPFLDELPKTVVAIIKRDLRERFTES